MIEVYRYAGALRSGEKQRGFIVAISKEDAIKQLERRGVYVTKINRVSSILIKITPVDNKQIALIFDGLSKMISSGISQIDAIDYLIREQFNPKLAIVLYRIRDNLQKGMSFHKSFEETGFFPFDVVKMLEVGVESGKLAQVLDSLKEYYEQKEVIKKAIIGAVTYPSLIIVALFLIILFGSPKMIEPMMAFYKNFEGKVEFPQFSLMVVSSVKFISKIAPILVICIVGSIYMFTKIYRSNLKFKEKVDIAMLRLPLVGNFIKKLSVYKFLLSFSILYKAGISISEALKMISSTMGNEIIKREFNKTYDQVRKGISIDRAVRTNKFIPNMVKSLIAIGVESGKLDVELETLTKYEKEAFNAYVNFIKGITVPVSMAIAGSIIGVIVIAVYLPILSMMDLLKSGF